MPATATRTTRPPRSGREIARALRPVGPSLHQRFSPDRVTGLPEPARRWLNHAIRPDAPLARRAALRMHGEIRLGRHWHDFTATQILVPDAGFVWMARTRIAGIPVTGFDGYADGVGTMRWQMLGVPIVRESGGGVSRSALDRLVAESVMLPTCMLDVAWSQISGPDSATFVRQVNGRYARSPVTIEVDGDGRLRRLRMRRWGNPAGGAYDLQPFAVRFDGEHDTGVQLVPDGMRASWPNAGGEFFRAFVDAVQAGSAGNEGK